MADGELQMRFKPTHAPIRVVACAVGKPLNELESSMNADRGGGEPPDAAPVAAPVAARPSTAHAAAEGAPGPPPSSPEAPLSPSRCDPRPHACVETASAVSATPSIETLETGEWIRQFADLVARVTAPDCGRAEQRQFARRALPILRAPLARMLAAARNEAAAVRAQLDTAIEFAARERAQALAEERDRMSAVVSRWGDGFRAAVADLCRGMTTAHARQQEIIRAHAQSERDLRREAHSLRSITDDLPLSHRSVWTQRIGEIVDEELNRSLAAAHACAQKALNASAERLDGALDKLDGGQHASQEELVQRAIDKSKRATLIEGVVRLRDAVESCAETLLYALSASKPLCDSG